MSWVRNCLTTDPENEMRRKKVLIWLAVLALGLAMVGCVYLWTAQWNYDPRPLMDRLRKRNAGAAVPSMHFVVFGDSKLSFNFPTVLRRADCLSPDFCLNTGDIVNNGGGLTGKMQYQLLVEQAGWFLRKYPTWPVPGNHDIGSRDLGNNEDYMKNYAEFFGIETEDYSFSYQNAKFIAFGMGDIVGDEKRMAWLKEQLSSAAAEHIFVFLHYPFYTVGEKADVTGEAGLAKITGLFAEHTVVAVFMGHDHIYYRTRRNGVHYVISAGAGAEIYALEQEQKAVEGDAYYGADVDSQPTTYRFHYADGRPETILKRPIYYLLSVRISGENVSLQMIDAADGKVWDEASLKGAANN